MAVAARTVCGPHTRPAERNPQPSLFGWERFKAIPRLRTLARQAFDCFQLIDNEREKMCVVKFFLKKTGNKKLPILKNFFLRFHKKYVQLLLRFGLPGVLAPDVSGSGFQVGAVGQGVTFGAHPPSAG